MNLSLLILKRGDTLIALCEQLDYEPACHLVKPHTISGKTKLTFTKWPEYSGDDHILINTEELLTVIEPSVEVREAYMKKIGITEEDLKPKAKPVILNEEDETPTQIEEDDYEPEYLEM